VFVVRLSKSVGRGQTKVSVKLGLCALKQKKSVRGELVEKRGAGADKSQRKIRTLHVKTEKIRSW
jgi:hypothetical protein